MIEVNLTTGDTPITNGFMNGADSETAYRVYLPDEAVVYARRDRVQFASNFDPAVTTATFYVPGTEKNEVTINSVNIVGSAKGI